MRTIFFPIVVLIKDVRLDSFVVVCVESFLFISFPYQNSVEYHNTTFFFTHDFTHNSFHTHIISQKEKKVVKIGRVSSIESNNREVQGAKMGDEVCVKIEQSVDQAHIAFGRHFDATNQLYSRMTRKAIDILKRDYKDELKKADWQLVIRFKSMFGII